MTDILIFTNMYVRIGLIETTDCYIYIVCVCITNYTVLWNVRCCNTILTP